MQARSTISRTSSPSRRDCRFATCSTRCCETCWPLRGEAGAFVPIIWNSTQPSSPTRCGDWGGFEEELAEWDAFVRAGLCTMNPHIGQWIRMQAGVNDRPQAIPMRLADAVSTIVPDGARLLDGHHDAGNDAVMHWRLFRELDLRAKA